MAFITLLGPQLNTPDAAQALREAGITGPVALVTAGYQERETQEGLLGELGVKTVNLTLHARSEDVFGADPEFAIAYKARQARLRAQHDMYRIRLDHAFEAAKAISVRNLESELMAEEREASVRVLRNLDAEHLMRSQTVTSAFELRWKPSERKAVAKHQKDLKKLLEPTEAVVIAGGHVASLLYRLRLFDVVSLWGKRPIVAASGGAMVLTERIYLFHDFPPHGTGVAEVLDVGLGLVKDLVVLPDPQRRLNFDDREGISRFVRRTAPAACLVLGDGARVFTQRGKVTRTTAHRLLPTGEVQHGGGP